MLITYLKRAIKIEVYQALIEVGVEPERTRLAVNAIHREIERATSLKTAEHVRRTDLTEFATKSDLKATKSDLQAAIEKLKNSMIQWFLATSASIVASVVVASKLLR